MKQCYFCRGIIVKKKMRHIHHWGDEIMVFEDVPAEVCSQCGEVYLSPEVLAKMDEVVKNKTTPQKSITIPVFSLS